MVRWLSRRWRTSALVLAYALLLLASQATQWRSGQATSPNASSTNADAPLDPSAHVIELPRCDAQGDVAGPPVRMAYSDAGEGPVVLLLHGSPGSRRDLRHLVAHLAGRYRLLAPDLPGFGESDRRLPDYGIRAHARYVLALLDRLEIAGCHVFGFSMGSGVALNLCDLAPQRVASLSVFGGIGVQEGEGSGDYHFEHLKYAIGHAAIAWAPEALPHFGLLGRYADRHAFIRNFQDTDQRPLRGVLEALRAPLLILHGVRDPLVPAWTAREHHRIVRHSQLVMLDDSHFMLFDAGKSAVIASHLAPFLERVESSGTVVRATHDPFAGQSAESLLPGQMKISRDIGPWWQVLGVIAATFVSEDLTCTAVGLLIHHQEIDLFVGFLACFLGIFLSDLALWCVGRTFRARLLRWHWLQHHLPTEHVEQLGEWFDRQGWRAVVAARFVPGTRLPIYIGAGMVGRRARSFIVWALIAGLIWTPLLITLILLLGDAVLRPLRYVLGHGWMTIAVAILLLFIAIESLPLLATRIGRARLRARLARLWRWEFWPAWLFYLPTLPYVAYLAIRHRGLTTPTAANPGIPAGGVVGESKHDILRKLPPEWIVPTARIPAGDADERVARFTQLAAAGGWPLPLVFKPDAGQRGAGVKLIRALDEARAYLTRTRQATLVQHYHPGPLEAGIFYYRLPAWDHAGRPGRILSVTDKHFPVLVGDGCQTVEQLVWAHPRFRMQADLFHERLDGLWHSVPAPGQRLPLALAGNHCQGTMFRDGGHLLTPQLERAIDAIARHYEGFYFGRFDVRYADVEELRAGRGFKIIELNGVTSESTNVYDPSWPIWRAYRTLRTQLRLAYEIGSQNRARGHRVTPLGELWHEVRRFYKQRDRNFVSD